MSDPSQPQYDPNQPQAQQPAPQPQQAQPQQAQPQQYQQQQYAAPQSAPSSGTSLSIPSGPAGQLLIAAVIVFAVGFLSAVWTGFIVDYGRDTFTFRVGQFLNTFGIWLVSAAVLFAASAVVKGRDS